MKKKTDRLGFLVIRDSIARVHPRPMPDTSHMSTQFGKIQRKFAQRKLSSEDPVVMLALALMACDAIVTMHDLSSALCAAHNVYRYREWHAIEWQAEDGRLDRRLLSVFTLPFVHAVTDTPISLPDAKAAIDKLANLCFPAVRDPVTHLFRAASAWCYEQLEGFLLSHVVRSAPMTALPRSAYAREISGLALKSNTSVADDHMTVRIMAAGFDVALSTQRQGSSHFVQRIADSCALICAMAPETNRKEMLAQLHILAASISEADSMSALILCWATDLIESGSAAGKKYHPVTIQKYIRASALKIHARISMTDLLEKSGDEFKQIYTEMIGEEAAGNRGTLASGLSAWHRFLVMWLDVPTLPGRLHALVEEVLPAANTIWPTENARILDWLEWTSGDERLIAALKLAVNLIWEGRLRATELMRTHMMDVHFYGDVAELDIAFTTADGTHKSPSGRRTLIYQESATVKALRDFHARRKAEGAIGLDYLFGDPHKPREVYRRGLFYVSLNKITRAATGDASVSLHTWSHSFASRRVRSAYQADSGADIDPLDQVAVEMGHGHFGTTKQHYVHEFEPLLRAAIDRVLLFISLPSSQAEVWTGIKSTTLRQRAFGKSCSLADVVRAALADQLQSNCSCNPVTHGFEVENPVNLLENLFRDPDDFEKILLALKDVAAGEHPSIIASRANRSEHWVGNLVQAADMAMARLLDRSPRFSVQPISFLADVVDDLNSREVGSDFFRVAQGKWRAVRSWLAEDDGEVQSRLIASWLECSRNGYLSLEDPKVARELFMCLQAAGVLSDRLALSISRSDADDVSARIEESRLQLVFREAFGAHALVEYKHPRRGRPRHYLIWSSLAIADNSDIGVASLSLGGFHALVLACATLKEMQRQGWRHG